MGDTRHTAVTDPPTLADSRCYLQDGAGCSSNADRTGDDLQTGDRSDIPQHEGGVIPQKRRFANLGRVRVSSGAQLRVSSSAQLSFYVNLWAGFVV